MNNVSVNTQVLIVDDHEVVIEGIAGAVAEMEGFEVVGVASDGHQAVEMVGLLKPDIVIMDIAMPNQNGVQAAQLIRQQFPETQIVIYTMFSDVEYLIELLKSDISGYVLKQEPFSRLTDALDVVKAGGSYFNANTLASISSYLKAVENEEKPKSVMSALSPREKQVFVRLADGKPIKRIASELSISPKTVEAHKYHIMAKLGVKTTTEMTKIAIR